MHSRVMGNCIDWSCDGLLLRGSLFPDSLIFLFALSDLFFDTMVGLRDWVVLIGWGGRRGEGCWDGSAWIGMG